MYSKDLRELHMFVNMFKCVNGRYKIQKTNKQKIDSSIQILIMLIEKELQTVKRHSK